MSSTFTVYKTLIAAYKRLGRDTAELALRIDATYALGRLSDDEYAELILSVTPEAANE